jgi:hypothetical protein
MLFEPDESDDDDNSGWPDDENEGPKELRRTPLEWLNATNKMWPGILAQAGQVRLTRRPVDSGWPEYNFVLIALCPRLSPRCLGIFQIRQ